MEYKITVNPGHINTESFGYYMFSIDYFKAAVVVSNIDFKKRINYPAYFLYCRSIELVIKAVLLAEGNESKNIWKHDFDFLISELSLESKKMLKIDEECKKTLLLLNKWYKTEEKGFEFYRLETGIPFLFENSDYPELPEMNNLKQINKKMLNLNVKNFVNK